MLVRRATPTAGCPVPPGPSARHDLVVDARPGQPGDVRALADADGLDRGNRHDGLRQAAVELAIPLHVAAQAHRQSRDDDLERAAERVAGLLGLVDGGNHLLLDGGIGAAQRRVDGNRADPFDGNCQRLVDADAADHRHVAQHLDAELRQQLARQRSDGDARRGLARAGTFEHVADVGQVVLERAGEIGMAGPRPRHGRAVGAGGRLRHLRLDVHRLLPVLPVLVRDEQGDRARRWCVRGGCRRAPARCPIRSPSGGRGRSRPAGASTAR